MGIQLDDVEVRVLGALMEKEVATPEYLSTFAQRAGERVQPEIQP